ncbi:MAG: L,D-transpeptidase family protein [Clostridiales bacterium]|jgi:lipoprotein-anchoring transpeptidase ErfK/SrfK|nr:L,D-transpeptidase family protein [Clostridiales bacterium]
MIKRAALCTLICLSLGGFALGECVVPCPVYAEALGGGCFDYPGGSSGRLAPLSPGEPLEILMDRSEQWYYTRRADGSLVWVRAESLAIPPDEPAASDDLSVEFLEYYARENLTSDTGYVVMTEIYRQRTRIFRREGGNWRLVRSLPCSTGRNASPTTRGRFRITERGGWFYSWRLGSGARYWVRFNDTYLFHSVAMDRSRRVVDPTIGEKASSGCVRFGLADAKWFYETVPDGTAVYII